MSWLQKLYETYPHIEGAGGNAPWPDAHIVKNAHVEVVVDIEGNFQRAKVLDGLNSATLIPVTEKSAARTGNIDPHPLCEELSYCALDLYENVKAKEQRNKRYLDLMSKWCESPLSHPKVEAVRKYVLRSTLWSDVSRNVAFPVAFKGKSAQKITANKCFIRWRVEVPGDLATGTWEDPSLVESWIKFEQTLDPKKGFCYVTGEDTRLAKFHPKFIRHAADGARFITQNDWDSFTFLGRFTDHQEEVTKHFKPSQVSEVAYDVTQKAHNALRWLIANQGHKNGDQVVVAWAVSGNPVPSPIASTYDLDNYDEVPAVKVDMLSTNTDITTDLGQSFARALNLHMAGYFDGRITTLKEHESIVIIGLDSATPGRMAITYYREFLARDYVQVIEDWHLQMAWPQRFSKEVQASSKKTKVLVSWPASAPSPWNILQATYGNVAKGNEELKKSLYERLMPCILEGRPLPLDIVNLAVSRASNRDGLEQWEWERNLGVACSLYKGFHHPDRQPDPRKWRNYDMSLDTQCASRDYLFGRLLAVAERIEEMAMLVAHEPSRSTQASRLMQRYADRPASTWMNIRKALEPYIQRLRARRPPLASAYNNLLDDICASFDRNDFISDRRLSGEYLLGFHCQRKWLRDYKLENGQWVAKSSEDGDSETQEESNDEHA